MKNFRTWSSVLSIARVLTCMTMCMTTCALAHAQRPFAPGKTADSRELPQSADPLEVKLVRNKIVLVDGKETAQSATIARPGEILEEIATYTNKSKSPIRKLEATLPIPPNTELLVASIKPGNAKASVDGRQFFALPLKRKVKQENGEKGVEIEQLIPLREYKYLRWYPGELGGEKSVVFSARFKVSNGGTPAVTPDRK